MKKADKLTRFEEIALPHMDAAYNLARWLIRDSHDAEDRVQEAYLRAFKFFDGFRGGDARAWLLTIVRNTCYTWLRQRRGSDSTVAFDEELHDIGSSELAGLYQTPTNPETLMLQEASSQLLQQAMDSLPVEFRETLILRDMEELSYKQIAAITHVPVGTVMSRLARARARLQQCLSGARQGDA